jgi:hypothetical protein
MAESFIYNKSKGGLKIQEPLKSFTVAPGQTITAGTFVDYISDSGFEFGERSIYNIYTNFRTSIAVLNPNKVVVAYGDAENNYTGFLKIGTINDDNSTTWSSSFEYSGMNTQNFSIAALTSDKIIITYANSNAFNRIGRIATITNDSITLGNPSSFNSTPAYNLEVIALSSNKVLIIYNDQGNFQYQTAIIGIIDGDNISWGSKYVFNTSTDGSHVVTKINDNKIAVVFRTSGFGTAKLGFINGTAISWSSNFVFNSANTHYISIAKVNDNQIAIVYTDYGNFARGTAIIGTVSDTSIFWSPEYFFNDIYSTTYNHITTLENNRIVIAYSEGEQNYNYPTTIIGDITQEGILWSNKQMLFTAGVDVQELQKLNTDKIIVAYKNGTTGQGTARVGETIKEIINTDSEKFFGLATENGIEGESVEVYLNGTVNDN